MHGIRTERTSKAFPFEKISKCIVKGRFIVKRFWLMQMKAPDYFDLEWICHDHYWKVVRTTGRVKLLFALPVRWVCDVCQRLTAITVRRWW